MHPTALLGLNESARKSSRQFRRSLWSWLDRPVWAKRKRLRDKIERLQVQIREVDRQIADIYHEGEVVRLDPAGVRRLSSLDSKRDRLNDRITAAQEALHKL